jgi:outer membrane protein OmpA-like peptidoglycan-associated protein
MVLGLALSAASCAHHAKEPPVQNLAPKAAWRCPQGTYPDVSKKSPNCLSRTPWTQAQVDQVLSSGKSGISFSCPAGTFPDATQPMPNCHARTLNMEQATAGLSGAELDQRLQAAREEGAREAEKQYQSQLAEKEREFKEQGEQAQAGQEQTGQEVELAKRVAFKSGSAELSSASKSTLDEVASSVKSDENVSSILVEGHADNTGTKEINDKISEQRALSIRDYLEQKGVPGDKIQTQSYGDTAPIASNDNSAGRALNRSAAITAMK